MNDRDLRFVIYGVCVIALVQQGHLAGAIALGAGLTLMHLGFLVIEWWKPARGPTERISMRGGGQLGPPPDTD